MSILFLGSWFGLNPTPGAPPVRPGVVHPAVSPTTGDAEIDGYRLRAGEKIAEIGAGDAAFARRLLQAQPQIRLWLTDVNRRAIQKLQWSLQHDPVLQRAHYPVQIVAGSNRSTRLEGKALDKVILRDAFHHFEHPAAMVASIQLALKSQGVVFLFERYREECQVNCCAQLLTRSQLLRPWQQQGFRLLSETPVYHQEGWWTIIALGRGKL